MEDYFPDIQHAQHLDRRGDAEGKISLLLGNERVHHDGVLVGVAIILVMPMGDGVIPIVLIMACGGMRPMAVVHLDDGFLATALTNPTTLQTKRLSPANRQEGDQAKNKSIRTQAGHAEES